MFYTNYCRSWNIEKQALKFYTREVFERFRKILAASTKFYPVRSDGEGLCFDLEPNTEHDIKTYRVQVEVENGVYTCGCNSFEMCGVLCAHIIRVMVHLNVQQIPDRYMLHRWSAAATTPAPDPGKNGTRFGVPGTNTLKYNALCRKMNDLASDACISDDTYAVVSGMIDEARKIVGTMRRAQAVAQQVGEDDATTQVQNRENQQQQPPETVQQQPEAKDAPATSELRNPARVKPKGRPSEKEKRRKPLVELREEANKKRQKKAAEAKTKKEGVPKAKRKPRVKKCPFCQVEGHTVQECKDMVLAQQMYAERTAGADLRL